MCIRDRDGRMITAPYDGQIQPGLSHGPSSLQSKMYLRPGHAADAEQEGVPTFADNLLQPAGIDIGVDQYDIETFGEQRCRHRQDRQWRPGPWMIDFLVVVSRI